METTGRLAFRPLKDTGIAVPADLQLGFSGSYAKIDRNNVRLDVKTTGLTSFLEVTSSAKFHVIQDADSRYRLGADLGVSFGPWAVWGEYTKIKFEDVEAGTDVFSFDAQDAYGSVMFMLTGERICFENGRIMPVEPARPVTEGGLGALGIAFRYDDFEADQAVYGIFGAARKFRARSHGLQHRGQLVSQSLRPFHTGRHPDRIRRAPARYSAIPGPDRRSTATERTS